VEPRGEKEWARSRGQIRNRLGEEEQRKGGEYCKRGTYETEVLAQEERIKREELE
jgi:hypothetical protein